MTLHLRLNWRTPAICLLIGFLMNAVVVAVLSLAGAAETQARGHIFQRLGAGSQPANVHVHTHHGFGIERFVACANKYNRSLFGFSEYDHKHAPLPPARRLLIEATESLYVVNQIGWPARAVVTKRVYYAGPELGEDAIRAWLPKGRTSISMVQEGLFPDGAFPRVPLFSGIIINTLFYATLAYLLIPAFAFKHTRTCLRSRRNLCTRCAYPRDHLPSPDAPCPECGAG